MERAFCSTPNGGRPLRRGFSWWPLLTLIWCAPQVAALALTSEAPVARFRLQVQGEGLHRVTFEELERGRPGLEAFPADAVVLSALGESQPVWLHDAESDGEFGPGDWLEFLVQQQGQDGRYHHDSNRFNTLQLEVGGARGVAGVTRPLEASPQGSPIAGPRRRLHFEQDRMLVRLKGSQMTGGWGSDLWFWDKITYFGRHQFRLEMGLPDLDRSVPSSELVQLRIGIRALYESRDDLRGELPGHQVDVYLGDEQIGSETWDGTNERVVTLDVAPTRFPMGENVELMLKVPMRTPDGLEDPIVDVVMINWVEASYRSDGKLHGAGQRDFLLAGEPVRVQGKDARWVYGESGWRSPIVGSTSIPGSESSERIVVVAEEGWSRPVEVAFDQPSTWSSPNHSADYLMISHASLIEAVQPLADFHRARGLEVALVDVQDVFDEFSYGRVDPTGIRDFVRHAKTSWSGGRQPEFVLLVGDASWDVKNSEVDNHLYANHTSHVPELYRTAEFAGRVSQAYESLAPEALGHRNLIPTSLYASVNGHAASDNYFVATDDDWQLPELAIGRFPVVEPEEVAAIVRKTIRYAEDPEPGPWRAEALWITNEQLGFQLRTTQHAADTARRGLGPSKVYPQKAVSNLENQRALRSHLDDGKLLVHFLGHGGRFIWRTGYPDLKKNNDLFTLDDLDQLQPTERLPVILSMTCFSAPFDHPDADSIGEKFLRMGDRGAVAVLAASWRNAPSSHFSDEILRQLTEERAPLGTAIMEAKRAVRRTDLLALYNLLGDPALQLALPEMELLMQRNADRSVHVQVPTEAFSGRAIVRWLDEEGEVLVEETVDQVGEDLLLSLPEELSERDTLILQTYVWDEERRLDGLGTLLVSSAEPSEAAPATLSAG